VTPTWLPLAATRRPRWSKVLFARVVRSLSAHARQALRPTPARATDPYGTHVPILVGLGRLLRPRHVLELGAGRHSTITFLDRTVFTEIEHIDSYETDAHWRDEVLAAAGCDPRLTVSMIDGPMRRAVEMADLDRYDLVLIDDSVDEANRVASIEAVARYRSPSNVVVIHDFEIHAYRHAARRIPHLFAFTALNPQTGVGWDAVPLDVRQLRRLAAFIARHAHDGEPHSRDLWRALIDAHLELQCV
jgi:predicted O-methyltransferase YrrM